MSILIFFLVLFVLILVHEFGHFWTAKKTGMRVDEFGIGFPPKLFGIKKGETEYTFNALPIGGFVRIYGEDETSVSSSPVSSEARDRRSEADAEAGEGGRDSARAFCNRPKWAQAVVLVAGVAMNVLFAWLLFALAFGLGTQQVVDEATAGESARTLITNIVPESPAASSDIPVGAEVIGVSANGERADVTKPTDFISFLSTHGESEVTIVYKAGEEELQTVLTPAAGLIADDPDRKAVGVSLAMVDKVALPIHIAIYEGFLTTVNGLVAVTVGIFTLLSDAIVGQADLSQVAGPVGIVGLVGEASQIGITTLLMFTAFISLNLAVINLLPFPALDGGRLLFVIIEAIKGTSINPKIAYGLNAAGFVLLILLMVVITFNDIARLV